MYEVIIESPFITNRRLYQLLPVIKRLKDRRVRVVVNTRDPNEQNCGHMREDAQKAVAELQYIGVHVVYTESHHRKLAIIDRQILYEGSLNILSQNDSREIMRRIVSTELAWQMAKFVAIDKYLS
jgi:phosphatidylserine/phosphatidylglycerophosphate/cardiolipin synthase-like enzyme